MRRVALVFCCIGTMTLFGSSLFAGNDDIGPIVRSAHQTLVCMIHCDGDAPCGFTMKIRDAEANTLKAKTFNNVPDNGIRKLVYAGSEKLVSCEVSDQSGAVGEPSWTVLDIKGKVEAMGTNEWYGHRSDAGPVWNASGQTPVCVARCHAGPCDFRFELRNKSGGLVMSQMFSHVPNRGSRKIAYGGGANPVSCEVKRIENKQGDGVPRDPGWAILDNKGNTIAYMSNDSGEPD